MPGTKRGQSGDKAGTKRGQIRNLLDSEIFHSFLIKRPPFFFLLRWCFWLLAWCAGASSWPCCVVLPVGPGRCPCPCPPRPGRCLAGLPGRLPLRWCGGGLRTLPEVGAMGFPPGAQHPGQNATNERAASACPASDGRTWRVLASPFWPWAAHASKKSAPRPSRTVIKPLHSRPSRKARCLKNANP